jgi:long-chain acyl-CoA synthetase
VPGRDVPRLAVQLPDPLAGRRLSDHDEALALAEPGARCPLGGGGDPLESRPRHGIGREVADHPPVRQDLPELHRRMLASRPMARSWPDPRTFASLLELVETVLALRRDEPAIGLATEGQGPMEWTGAELAWRAELAAWRMRALGLTPGSRLLTWAASGPDLVALFLGALRAEVILVPLDLRMTDEVVLRIAGRAEAHWMAVGPELEAEARALPPGLEVRRTAWFVGEPDEIFPSDWRARLAAWPRPTRETPFAIMFTSGTTGHPKGAVLSHGNLLATLEAADRIVPHRHHRIVSVLPLSHLFGQAELFFALLAGAPVLYIATPSPRAVFEAVRAHRVTTMVVVPQVLELFWTALQRAAAREGRAALLGRLRRVARRLPYPVRRRIFRRIHAELGGRLRLFISAAAYLPPSLQAAWQDLGVTVIQGYGATECGFAAAQTERDHRPGTVGRPMEPVTLRLAPETGEVQVTGPSVFSGYWRDPIASQAALDDDGWYRTGDVGRWDRDGNLVLVGRLRDVIVLPNGFNVYPEDIEQALRRAGLPESVAVETAPGRIEAVLLQGDPPLERTVIDAAVRTANAELDIHQRIAAWHTWPDDDFPRTHTLKVRKDLVRASLTATS